MPQHTIRYHTCLNRADMIVEPSQRMADLVEQHDAGLVFFDNRQYDAAIFHFRRVLREIMLALKRQNEQSTPRESAAPRETCSNLDSSTTTTTIVPPERAMSTYRDISADKGADGDNDDERLFVYSTAIRLSEDEIHGGSSSSASALGDNAGIDISSDSYQRLGFACLFNLALSQHIKAKATLAKPGSALWTSALRMYQLAQDLMMRNRTSRDCVDIVYPLAIVNNMGDVYRSLGGMEDRCRLCFEQVLSMLMLYRMMHSPQIIDDADDIVHANENTVERSVCDGFLSNVLSEVFMNGAHTAASA